MQNGCRVIAVANQKGGVGKTTTTLNLGIGLAKENKRVLIVDCDPQGNLTTSIEWRGTRQPNLEKNCNNYNWYNLVNMAFTIMVYKWNDSTEYVIYIICNTCNIHKFLVGLCI